MQHRTTHLGVAFIVCLLAGCASPWDADWACLNQSSYTDRVDCQVRNQRAVHADDKAQRKEQKESVTDVQKIDATDPLCYKKAGAGEKPCAN